MAKDKKAKQALERARTVLLVAHPFFGTLALQLEVIEVEDPKFVDTMAVDGVHMYYHPPFVLSLSEQELIGVLAHEILHCAYQHMTRRGDRNSTVHNWACDYVINPDLKEAGFTLPGQPIPWGNTQPGIKGHLLDPRFAGMSSEEVYEILWKEVPKVKISIAGQGFGMGGVMDTPGDSVKNAEIQAEWEGNVRMAAQVAAGQQAGQLPGYLKRLVQGLNKPKISWRDQTREFVDESMQKDFSWSRINRRSASVGVLMPGMISDSMQHLVLVLDHSGSINDRVLLGMISEGQGTLDDRVADKLTLIYADDGVRQVNEYFPGDMIQADVLGGGGTNFRPTFEWIKENASDASCVIYLTDMYTSDFGDEPSCPVLWGVWGSESTFPALAKSAPFGRAIFVEPEH